MAKRFVYGSYATTHEAQAAVESLVRNGVPEASIAIIGQNSVINGIGSNVEIIPANEVDQPYEKGFWDSVVELFYPEESDENRTLVEVEGYETELNSGKILVAVDNEYNALADTLGGTDMKKNEYNEFNEKHLTDVEKVGRKDIDIEGKETIQLHEERIIPHAESQKVGDVEITKEVIRDTETVEVPVEKEVLNVTRKPVNEKVDNFDNDAFKDETVTIPLREDKVVLDKETVVTEEIELDKTVERSNQVVNQETRKEVLDIDKDQNIVEKNSQYDDFNNNKF